MKTSSLIASMFLMLLTACASGGKAGKAMPGMTAQLKVSAANSQLRARILMRNESQEEIVLKDLNSRYFVIETTDGKSMQAKANSNKNSPALAIKAGGGSEAIFMLQDNYGFYDRLTKYKIWYDGPSVKTEPVLVWF